MTTENDPTKDQDSTVFEKLKKEKENWREKAQREEKEKQELLAKIKEIEEKSLKEKEDYKNLYEKAKVDLQNKETLIATERAKSINFHKTIAVKELFAKEGATPEVTSKLFKLAELDKIKYDEETGTVFGHEEIVKQIKTDYAPMFATTTTPPNQSAPKFDNGKFDMGKLSAKDLTKKETLEAAFKSAGVEVR